MKGCEWGKKRFSVSMNTGDNYDKIDWGKPRKRRKGRGKK
jgi:hypothetical protein